LLGCDFLFENDESIGGAWKVSGVLVLRSRDILILLNC
jgi:hypothetical protein